MLETEYGFPGFWISSVRLGVNSVYITYVHPSVAMVLHFDEYELLKSNLYDIPRIPDCSVSRRYLATVHGFSVFYHSFVASILLLLKIGVV